MILRSMNKCLQVWFKEHLEEQQSSTVSHDVADGNHQTSVRISSHFSARVWLASISIWFRLVILGGLWSFQKKMSYFVLMFPLKNNFKIILTLFSKVEAVIMSQSNRRNMVPLCACITFENMLTYKSEKIFYSII